jgi:hypothetical protein
VAYVAVLDADVLHPYILVDLLLRLAERRLFRPAWTEEILTEVRDHDGGVHRAYLEARPGARNET